jgi:hypothetical protein
VSFRSETKRFSRDASLELLGLAEADETTHTDAFKIMTQPDKRATYYSEPEFWKASKASYGMLLKASQVIFPDQTKDPKSLAARKLMEMLPVLHIEVTAVAGEKPISLNLSTTGGNS